MSVLNVIASSNFIVMNKILMKKIGINETLLLGEFASEYDYWNARGELSDGFFFSTIENIEQATTLNEYAQRKAINNLKKMGIVEVKMKGLPCKRYVKINEEVVLEILNIQFLKNQSSSSLKFKELDTENLKGNNNIINNNIINKNKNNIYIEDEELKNTFNEFKKMRKAIKKPLTEYAEKRIFSKLQKLTSNTDEQIEILNNSIVHGWQDVYPLKNQQNGTSNSTELKTKFDI